MQPIENTESLEFPVDLFIMPVLWTFALISLVAALSLI